MSPAQKLEHSHSLVQANLKAAQSALDKSTQSISDMKKFLKTQKGSAKKQLSQVLAGKETYHKSLEEHIKEGTKFLSGIDKKMAELTKELESKQKADPKQEEKKQEPTHTAQVKAEAKVEVKVEAKVETKTLTSQ